MISARVVAVPVIVLVTPALVGCTATPHRGSVTAAARSFVQKLRAGDDAAACALLTDNARSSVAGATDASCPDAIKGVKEQGAAVGGVQVWGDAAQVRIGGDVVFLRLVSGAWKVSAAGCTPQPERPYDCKVGG